MKSLIVAFVLVLCCLNCTATEKAAMKDCVARIVPVQIAATFEECGLDNKACLDRVAAERALIAADYVAACVEAKDASGTN